MVKFKELKKA